MNIIYISLSISLIFYCVSFLRLHVLNGQRAVESKQAGNLQRLSSVLALSSFSFSPNLWAEDPPRIQGLHIPRAAADLMPPNLSSLSLNDDPLQDLKDFKGDICLKQEAQISESPLQHTRCDNWSLEIREMRSIMLFRVVSGTLRVCHKGESTLGMR